MICKTISKLATKLKNKFEVDDILIDFQHTTNQRFSNYIQSILRTRIFENCTLKRVVLQSTKTVAGCMVSGLAWGC